MANPKSETKAQGMEEKILALRALLGEQQLEIKDRLPVLVLVEGFAAVGRGRLISKLIADLDPRFFKVVTMKPPNEEERRHPFIQRHFSVIPGKGSFAFVGGTGYLEELCVDRYEGTLSKDQYDARVQEIDTFERQLVEGGYVIVKLFLDIDQKRQLKRLRKLHDHPDARWRVSQGDLRQCRNYQYYRKLYLEIMRDTGTVASWCMVDSENRKEALCTALTQITDAITAALSGHQPKLPAPDPGRFSLIPMPKLSEVSFADKTLPESDYRTRLDAAQKRLGELHNRIYRLRVPVVLCYEGWDAAGKGGNIKRLTRSLDPRGFEVFPIAAPEPHELARHYLWRFMTRLPKTGHVALFDRTWYGRVMVERIEGFCSEESWKRAYNEINEFEYMLHSWGAIVMKFWIHVDKETQLERFNQRQNDPQKVWKITEEDWRNREKWNQYESAVDEMLRLTSTTFAPWQIIESVDKGYARVKAIELLISHLEEVLK